MSTLGHYAAIARMAPGALARSAVRRVQGAARHALYHRRSPLDEAQLLEAFGANRAEELAEMALGPRGSRVWCDVTQRASVREAVAAIPGALERAKARAEQALRQEWDVFGTRVVFGEGRPVDWSLDPVSGHRYPLTPVERMAHHATGRDPKYPWVLGRLDSLVALAQGAWLESSASARARLATAFVAQTLDFLQANPVGQGVHWLSAMEVSLRAANLAQALVMFADAPEVRRAAFLVPVLSALCEHTAWVEAHLEDQGAVPNNHLVANHVGQLVVGLLFPELPRALHQAALAVGGLRAQMEAQVHPEGTSFEGSVPYHRLAVELFTLAYVVARGMGVSLGHAYEARLRRMFVVAQAWTSEAGLAPQVGDNDSGRAFAVSTRGDCEQGYLSSLGAALWKDAGLGGGPVADEVAWLLGGAGLGRQAAQPALPSPVSLSLPQGGVHILRGAGAVVTVCAGRQGQAGVGGHSHNDKLSFELHLNGRPVIVDPGTGTYTRDPSLRNAMRGTAAHNTLQVDGAEQAPLDAARLFALTGDARARVVVFQPSAKHDRLVVRHDGYRALPSPVGIERTFVLDRHARALVVSDRLVGTGWHDVVGRLHLPDAQARWVEVGVEVLARARLAREGPAEFESLSAELGPPGAPLAWVLLQRGLIANLAPSRFSPGYGRVEAACAVEFRRGVTPPVCLRWVVVFQ
ncbi:heparinase II/III family protein [Corallococcus sp. M34]|uniref:heparinase II/III family protein n=1 Tax=Citreicoccus inhibens TaxID=2849499 RepID=UPI001C23E953|nr:alginate lyase family protein [Citreicoccus inhibens]MBU8898209.1 heparinase II/III family protein [Citreicoccus inhibens]